MSSNQFPTPNPRVKNNPKARLALGMEVACFHIMDGKPFDWSLYNALPEHEQRSYEIGRILVRELQRRFGKKLAESAMRSFLFPEPLWHKFAKVMEVLCVRPEDALPANRLLHSPTLEVAKWPSPLTKKGIPLTIPEFGDDSPPRPAGRGFHLRSPGRRPGGMKAAHAGAAHASLTSLIATLSKEK